MLRPARGLDPVDAYALATVGLWAAWVFATSTWTGRFPPPSWTPLLAPAVLLAGVVVGRLGRRWRDHPGTLVLLLFPLVALLPGVGLRMARGPLPLGYANANTAAATQVMALLALAALDEREDRARRNLLWVGIVVAAWMVVHHGSLAGIATAVPVLGAILLMASRPARRSGWALVVALVSVVAASASLLWLAARPTWPPRVLTAFDPVRKVMWEEALGLWARRPITGSGVGSYAEVNPYAHDTDTIAAHSSLLQTGAELGLVGVALLFGIVLAGAAVAHRGRAPLAVVALAAWTALWIHSLVDHLFDYPTVPFLSGAVLGWASASSARPGDPVDAVRTVPRPPG